MSWLRSSRTVGTVGAGLLVVGVVGLLMPVLVAPVMSDSKYHYLLSVVRFPSILDTVPWTIHDMDWRLRLGGRITPVGVWYQHVSYYLVMKMSLWLGVETWVGEAVVKAALVAGTVLAFRVLVGQLRGSSGARPSRSHAWVATAIFGALFAMGATTNHPLRNGWTTFVQLCIGGALILFAVGALNLWVVNRWPGWGRTRRALAAALLVVVAAALVLSYELHWAAYPFAVLLVLGQARPSWRRLRETGDRVRWTVVGWTSAGFLPTLLVTRLIIERYRSAEYPGLALDLGGPVLRTVGLQLVSAVPGAGLGQARRDLADLTGGDLPPAGSGGGWFWGLCTAVGLVLVVRALTRPGRPTGDADPGTAGPSRPAALGPRPWLVLAVASAVAGVAGAAILSVSVQSPEVVKAVGATYRPTPWIWAGASATVASLLTLLVAGSGRRRWLWAVAPALAALLVGVVVWPANAAVERAVRTSSPGNLVEEIQRQVVLGTDTDYAESVRCDLDASVIERRYPPLFYDAARVVFRELWGREFCPTAPGPPGPWVEPH